MLSHKKKVIYSFNLVTLLLGLIGKLVDTEKDLKIQRYGGRRRCKGGMYYVSEGAGADRLVL